MTSRELIIKTINLEKTERVPVTLYWINPFARGWESKDPSYSRLLKFAKEYQDTFAFASIGDSNFTYYLEATKEKQDPFVYKGVGNLGVFFSSPDGIKHEVRKTAKGNNILFETVIETSKGILHSIDRVNKNVATTWQVEPLIKKIKDVEKILSLPYVPLKIDLSQFLTAEKELGDKGIMGLSMPDPLGAAVPLFNYSEFLIQSFINRDKILNLLDFFYERLYQLIKRVSKEVKETVFRIFGPEYITPPMLPPEYFDQFVTKYDAKLIKLIQESGNFACIHCHGKLKPILEAIMKMKPDMLEPIEPPPHGDLTLLELKEKIGNEICLMGYIEFSDLEFCSTEEIDKKVKKAIEDGSGGGYILLPSSTPITSPLPKKTEENLIQFLKSGREYGQG